MLLVFGLTTTARLLGTPTRMCQWCGNRAEHHVVQAVRRFSLFFIPLFRVGDTRFYGRCTACGVDNELTEGKARSAAAHSEAVEPQDAPSWTPQDR